MLYTNKSNALSYFSSCQRVWRGPNSTVVFLFFNRLTAVSTGWRVTGKQQARIIVRDRRLVSLLGLRRGKGQGQVRSRSEKQSENKSWKVCMGAMLMWQGVKGVHLCIHILARSVVLMQRWKFPLQRNRLWHKCPMSRNVLIHHSYTNQIKTTLGYYLLSLPLQILHNTISSTCWVTFLFYVTEWNTNI